MDGKTIFGSGFRNSFVVFISFRQICEEGTKRWMQSSFDHKLVCGLTSGSGCFQMVINISNSPFQFDSHFPGIGPICFIAHCLPIHCRYWSRCPSPKNLKKKRLSSSIKSKCTFRLPAIISSLSKGSGQSTSNAAYFLQSSSRPTIVFNFCLVNLKTQKSRQLCKSKRLRV